MQSQMTIDIKKIKITQEDFFRDILFNHIKYFFYLQNTGCQDC